MGSWANIAKESPHRIFRWLGRIYYSAVDVTHPDFIPAKGPVLLAANHPNSLLDPVIVGLAARRPVHFLAKAPLFDIPFFGQVLRALGMLPAYRACDDASLLKRNVESLALAAVCLQRGEAVGIFPEGKSHDLPKVEQVRTGAARIAVQAAQAGVKELKLVPLGLNYERKERFQSAVWVQVGEPIDIHAWLREHPDDDERRVVRTLTAELDRRLKDVVVHLEEERWEPLLNDLEVLLPPPEESLHHPLAVLRQRKRIADAMNYFLRLDRPRAEAMALAMQQHRDRLAAAGLNCSAAILRRRGWRLWLRLAEEAILMDLGFVLVLAGTLHHLVPFFLTRFIAGRVQLAGRSTMALARLGLGLPVYSAWYAFTWWWMADYFRPWAAWTWLALMPLAGVLALRYWWRVKETSGLWWRQIRILFRPGQRAELRAAQDKLREALRELADEFTRANPPAPTATAVIRSPD